MKYMRLVKEEDELGLVEVALLGQGVKELGEHPQEEHGVDLRALDELCGVQDVNVALAVLGALEPIVEVERRLAKENVTALVLDRDQSAQNRAHRLGGDLAVGGLVLVGVLGHEVEHGAQVLEVDQKEVLVIGDAEDDVEHALLHLGKLEQARKQRRAHVGDGDTHRQTSAAEHIPDAHGAALVVETLDAKALDTLLHVLGVLACLRHTGDVALDVGHEHRNARLREALGHNLERNGLACTRGTGDKAVAVRLVEQQVHVLVVGLRAHTHPDGVLLVHASPLQQVCRLVDDGTDRLIIPCAPGHIGCLNIWFKTMARRLGELAKATHQLRKKYKRGVL